MKTPKRLTEEDRVVIAAMHKSGHRQKEIAAAVIKSPSTISKELKRNRCDDGAYRTQAAQERTRERKKRAPYRLRGWLAKAVAARLRRRESPYSIRISLQEKGLPAPSIESIHRFVERDAANGGTLWMFLPLKRLRRRPHRKSRLKHGPIPKRVDISLRPEAATARSEVGHWEGDTVHGAGPDGGAIVTLIDRKSRYLLMGKVVDLKSATVAKAVETMLRPFVRHSVTFDNGSEFAKHERITKRLECPCYFAQAGHPGQRGTLEQSNGLIRRIQPKKKTRYKGMRHEEVRHVQNLINGRRRKILAGKRPKDFLPELLRPTTPEEGPLQGPYASG